MTPIEKLQRVILAGFRAGATEESIARTVLSALPTLGWCERNAVLEQAAMVAEEHPSGLWTVDHPVGVGDQIAEAIRALKKPTP